ncbi:hypothetical protein [Bradyrhizobium sp. STM 3557]|uniref:hypothetical protein n=1 Tax=Bradyrhizobium sp. STM 3557 TaxID=578920 RepID=UPI0038903D08
MNDIIESVLKNSDREVGAETRERVAEYLHMLAQAGKTRRQLIWYGTAYVKELFEPDRRYSGC